MRREHLAIDNIIPFRYYCNCPEVRFDRFPDNSAKNALDFVRLGIPIGNDGRQESERRG